MTSSSRRFALDIFAAALAVVVAGCSRSDGTKEYAAAEAAYGLRDLKKAEKLAGECVRLAPANVDALVMAARLKIDLGEMAEARDFVEKAKSLAPGDSDVRLLDAYVACYQQEYARALETFGAIAGDPAMDAKIRSQALAGSGVVELLRNETDLARIDFLKALRLDRRTRRRGTILATFTTGPDTAKPRWSSSTSTSGSRRPPLAACRTCSAT